MHCCTVTQHQMLCDCITTVHYNNYVQMSMLVPSLLEFQCNWHAINFIITRNTSGSLLELMVTLVTYYITM